MSKQTVKFANVRLARYGCGKIYSYEIAGAHGGYRATRRVGVYKILSGTSF